MYKTTITLVRQLHTSIINRGSHVKAKISQLEKHRVIMRKTPSERARQLMNKRVKQKSLQKKAYPKQQAFHILKSEHGVTEDNLKSTELGPTSQSDLKFLTISKDRRLLYTILGVNGEQLRDSKLVTQDVEKFLKRSQLEKAIFLIRLARNKGIVGMNKMMEHYCNELQDANSAIDMYSWRKKWGISPNEFTHTILFDGLARLKNPLTERQGRRVVRIVSSLIESGKLNTIEFNSALDALVNCVNPGYVFEIYDMKPKGVTKDSITYTTILRAVAKLDDDSEALKRIEAIMATIPAKLIDGRLLFEYCKVWHTRKNLRHSQNAMIAINKFFDIDLSESIELLEGNPLSKISLKRRFPLDSFVINLFLDNCYKTENYKLATNTFSFLQKKHRNLLKSSSYQKMIEIVIKGYPTECSSKAVKLYQELEQTSEKSSKVALVLVYKAFEREAGKKFINNDPVKLNEMLARCHKFIMDFESKSSTELNARVANWRAWMFYWNVVKRGDERRMIDALKKKEILDEFIRTLLSGQLKIDRTDKKDCNILRHVELEAVRFLKSVAEEFKLEDTDDVKEEGLNREKFLFRRLLLRLKERLLEHVKVIELGQGDEVQEIEKAMEQVSERLLNTKLPATEINR